MGIGVYRPPADVTAPHELPNWMDAVLDKFEHLVLEAQEASEWHGTSLGFLFGSLRLCFFLQLSTWREKECGGLTRGFVQWTRS